MQLELLKEFPYETAKSVQGTGLAFFINYLNVLEGVKTKIKNLHWAAKKLVVNEHKGAHVYLDDFLEVVSDFQDTVAECSQGILGHMNPEDISGVPVSANAPCDLISYLLEKTEEFYKGLPENFIYVGIKSETESFVRDLTKYKYLFELTL